MKKIPQDLTIELRRKRWSVWSELLTSLLGVISSLVATVLATGLVERKPEGYWLIGAFVAILVVTTMFLTLRKERAAQTSDTRKAVEHAFLSALDNSPLNPKRMNEESYADTPRPN